MGGGNPGGGNPGGGCGLGLQRDGVLQHKSITKAKTIYIKGVLKYKKN